MSALANNDPRIEALALRRGLIHNSLLYKKLAKNQISNIQDALVQVKRYIRLEEADCKDYVGEA